jgi:hypothetical protein
MKMNVPSQRKQSLEAAARATRELLLENLGSAAFPSLKPHDSDLTCTNQVEINTFVRFKNLCR